MFENTYYLFSVIVLGHVAEVFGNVCSLSMTINGFGHDLQSTCRYQSSDSVHILPTFHSNCSSTITEREFQIYWLKPYDIDLPYDEDLVMTKQVKELFILNADTLKDNGGDNKGIFALSFRIKFMLNGTDSQTKQKVYFLYHKCRRPGNDSCGIIQSQMNSTGIPLPLEDRKKCADVVVTINEVLKKSHGQWSVIKKTSVTERKCNCVLLHLRDQSNKFEVQCNTTEPDLPKHYNVFYLGGLQDELLQDNTFPFNYGELDERQFKVVVTSDSFDDSYSSCTDDDIQILERYHDSGGTTTEMPFFPGSDISSDDSAVNQLIDSGNYSGAVNALSDVLSVLNTDNSTSQSSKEEKIEIRKAIINSLQKVNVSSLNDLSMVTDVLNSAVSVSEEMSEEAQDTALGVYSSLTSMLSAQVNASANDSTKGESAAGLLLKGLSNVLDYNTGIVTEELTITSHHTKINQSHLMKVEENTRAILHLVDNIADVALALTSPSETPVVYETPHMNLAVMKNTVANIIGKKLVNTKLAAGTNLVGSFKLPSDAAFSDVLSGVNGDVNLQMMLISKNPFVWHPSAHTITTPVVSMKIKDSNRNPVEVKNLKQPVRIQISNKAVTETTVFSSEINLVFKNSSYQLRNGKGPTFKLETNITSGYSLVMTIKGEELVCPFRIVEATENMTDPGSEPGLLLNDNNNYMMVSPSAEMNQSYNIYILPVLNSSSAEAFLTDYVIRNNYTTLCEGSIPCKREIILPMNFSMETYSVRCTYWNEITEVWTSDGCKVSEDTTKEVIHCECNHLTSFSGSFIVLPNAIDPFADAALFLNFFDNPLVVSTVVFVWFIYFSAVYWANKADKRDKAQTGIVVLSDANSRDPYRYLMCVVTGWWAGAETTARISCYVSGNGGNSKKHCLSDSVVNKGYFKAGWEDWFLFTSPYHLGNLESVTVWHDNSGTSPSWYLTRILVQDLKTNKVYSFILGDWIGIERGSAKVTIPHTKPEDIGNFRNQEFTFKSGRDIRDSHLWFSVFSKPCRSQFTRVQRLTCCLSLLLCTMLTSIMFHGMPTDNPQDQATVANFTFSIKDLIIGIECAIIMLPINILIVQLFMRTSSKPKEQRSSRRRYEFIWDDEKSDEENPQVDHEEEQLIENLEEIQLIQRPKLLPWWCVYIAWTIVILVSMVSSYFVMLYGLKYGYQKSLEWLISFFTAFFQSACLQQPMKVVAIAMVMTYICKKPVEIEGMVLDINLKAAAVYEDDGEYTHQHIIPNPASKSMLQQIKTKLQMEGIIEERIREIIIYFLFITVVLYAAHGNRNVRKSYWMGSAIEDIFIRQAFKKDRLTFSDANSPPLFWDFLRVKVLPGLDDIYNGDKDVETHGDDFIGVGPFRFRQLRVQSDTCPTPLSIRNMTSLSINCSDSYWLGNEDTKYYNQSWSETITESVNNHWSYQSAWQLGTLPYTGTLATYGGGGYVLAMYPNSSTQQIFDKLRSDSWINERTRALFVEFTIYNPNVNFFSVVMFLFEFSSNGGIFPFYQIFTTRLYHYSSSTKAALVFCELMFLVFTFIFSYYEFKKVRMIGFRQYLTGFWNAIEFIIICLSYSIIGLFFQRMVIVDYLMDKLAKSDRVDFVSFYPAIFWDFVQLYVMSFLVFLVILKFIKILSFNKNMHLLGDTLHCARDSLANFSFLIVILIFAFTHFAYLVFGRVLGGYKSLISSFVTSFTFALGVSDFYGLYRVERIIGPIFFVLFILFVMFIYLTVFMAIVNTSITKAKEAKLSRKNEFEVYDYLVIKLANILPVELAAKLKKTSTKPL